MNVFFGGEKLNFMLKKKYSRENPLIFFPVLGLTCCFDRTVPQSYYGLVRSRLECLLISQHRWARSVQKTLMEKCNMLGLQINSLPTPQMFSLNVRKRWALHLTHTLCVWKLKWMKEQNRQDWHLFLGGLCNVLNMWHPRLWETIHKIHISLEWQSIINPLKFRDRK